MEKDTAFTAKQSRLGRNESRLYHYLTKLSLAGRLLTAKLKKRALRTAGRMRSRLAAQRDKGHNLTQIIKAKAVICGKKAAASLALFCRKAVVLSTVFIRKAAAKGIFCGRKALCYGKKALQRGIEYGGLVFKATVKYGRTAGRKALCYLKSLDKRVKFSALAALLVLTVLNSYNYYTYINSFTYVVYLDGEEIGYVSEDSVIYEFMAALQSENAEKAGYDVGTRQRVTVAYELRKGILEDEKKVKSILQERIDFDRYAYMLTINDRPALAVACIEEYEKVIDGLKNCYTPDDENIVVQSVALTDTLETRLTLLDGEKIYSAEEALQILLNGSDRRETYMVSRGDTLWTIAARNNLTISEIREANPHLKNTDRLMPGDEISLVVPDPMVGVAVTEEIEAEEAIKYETVYKDDASLYKRQSRITQVGKNGKKKVLYRLTLLNGREMGREVLSEAVIEEPRQQIVARGTKPLPEGTIVGTGRFMWPVAGGGRITSPYGYRRGGFHYGVDIGAPIGTAVVAADGGTVIQSGWLGRYGLLVTIDHHNGYVTKYAHNSANLVSVGQKVQKGQQIARIGSTGNSTGPHLHFEVIKNGKNVNPLSYL